MAKNSRTILRISDKMKKDIKEISEGLDFQETDVTRYLLHQSIQRIKSASIDAGGFENLEITVGIN